MEQMMRYDTNMIVGCYTNELALLCAKQLMLHYLEVCVLYCYGH